MKSTTQRLTFDGHNGAKLAARLDLPTGPVRAFALFAHCFTCSKDTLAARRIASGLAGHGIAVMRFDFTGLGSSEGEFASTNFSSNVDDLVLAAEFLKRNYKAPEVLIGHSLGGAAVLAAASRIPSAKALATLGAPADTAHVLHTLGDGLADVEKAGTAEVTIGGREFTVQNHFVEDVRKTRLLDAIAKLKRPLLVMHAPRDAIVGVENATEIFSAAKHPKSYVSLDGSDHLLTDDQGASFAADVIAAWSARYVSGTTRSMDSEDADALKVEETGHGQFQNRVEAGRHMLLADEPKSVGGDDTGPSPYEYLAASLGACTSMTLRMYARHKKLDLGRISVTVRHKKVHGKDCVECLEAGFDPNARIDRFERLIEVDQPIDAELRDKLLEIADKCPVHKTLEAGAVIMTETV